MKGQHNIQGILTILHLDLNFLKSPVTNNNSPASSPRRVSTYANIHQVQAMLKLGRRQRLSQHIAYEIQPDINML